MVKVRFLGSAAALPSALERLGAARVMGRLVARRAMMVDLRAIFLLGLGGAFLLLHSFFQDCMLEGLIDMFAGLVADPASSILRSGEKLVAFISVIPSTCMACLSVFAARVAVEHGLIHHIYF